MQHKRFYLLITLSMVALFAAVVGLSSLSQTVQADVPTPADPAAVMPPLPEPAWSHTGIQQYAQEGASVTTHDLNGDGYSDLIVGEPNYNDGTTLNVGRVLIFYFDTEFAVFPSAPDVILRGTQAGARFGTSTAVGDFNGDGIYDLAVGIPGRNSVVVYNGNDLSGSNPTPIWSYTAQLNSEFGYSVHALRPLTTDIGYSYELVVGAPKARDGNNDQTGAVYLFFSDDTIGLPTPATPTLVRYGTPDSRFGHALASGDLNGDFFNADLVIGAPNTSIDYAQEGAAYVYYLDPDPSAISTLPDETYVGGQEEAFLGYAVMVDDVNNDGYLDLFISAPALMNEAGAPVGAVVAYWGQLPNRQIQQSQQALPGDWVVYGSFPGSWFGSAITAVDYNRDGQLDLAVGAKNQPYNLFTSGAGAVFFFFNDGSTLNNSYHWKLVGRNSNAWFGASLAAADHNNDNSGVPDELMVGAPVDSTESTAESGAVYHFPSLISGAGVYNLQLNGPYSVLFGQQATFSATVEYGQNILYEWDFGDGMPQLTTYSPDEMEPSVVEHYYPSTGQYLLKVRALQPQPYPLEEAMQWVGVGFPVNQLAIQSSTPTRLGNDTRFRVGVQSMGPVSLTLDFGNDIVETFNLKPGANILRLAHNYSNPGYYQVTAVAQNEAGVTWTQTTRARVVRAVSAQDGGQIQHEWGNDPARIFLVDVEEDAVDENYELHFNPVGDATFSNPFPEDENALLAGLDAWDADDHLTPLNIPIFFDLEVHDPLGDNCLFLPMVRGNGSGGSGSTATSPCLTGGGTSVDSFNEPLLLTFTYKDEDIPAGTNEADIRFFYFDTELNQWIDGATTCPGGSDASYIRDPANNTIKLPICHQSRWGIGAG